MELLFDPPDREDLAEKSSLFFLATIMPSLPRVLPSPVPPPWSVEEELWREGDRWMVGGEERAEHRERPRDESQVRRGEAREDRVEQGRRDDHHERGEGPADEFVEDGGGEFVHARSPFRGDFDSSSSSWRARRSRGESRCPSAR